MEARRLSHRVLAPKTTKHWILLCLMGFIASGAVGLFSYIATSSQFNFSWAAWIAIAVAAGVFVLNAVTSLPTEVIFLGGYGGFIC